MVREKIITEREALVRIDPGQMDYFLHPMLDYQQGERLLYDVWEVLYACISSAYSLCVCQPIRRTQR
jgi:hypothetical protein